MEAWKPNFRVVKMGGFYGDYPWEFLGISWCFMVFYGVLMNVLWLSMGFFGDVMGF